MIPAIDPSTPFADVLKAHGDKLLPLLPPGFRTQATTLAAAGMTLGQVQSMVVIALDLAARKAIVEAAPLELRDFLRALLVKE